MNDVIVLCLSHACRSEVEQLVANLGVAGCSGGAFFSPILGRIVLYHTRVISGQIAVAHIGIAVLFLVR